MWRAILLLHCSWALLAQSPLPRAHAHNDYLHPRPLADALSFGFGSVEADVFPVNGDLLVAHDRDKIDPARTLEKLYLAPLLERSKTNGGPILKGLPTLILLIDFKADGLLSCQILERQLEKFRPILTRFDGSNIVTNAVTVLLSGDRPRAYVEAQKVRWLALDGRLADLDANPPRALFPLVSDSWATHFKWREGPIPGPEKARLQSLVDTAHSQGRIIRFWATPDRPDAWEAMDSAGVDLINTDRLGDLAAFLNARPR